MTKMKTALEIEKKFLVKGLTKKYLPEVIYGYHSARIKQWYLPKDAQGRTSRIRSKYEQTKKGPVNTYYFTRKKPVSPGVVTEEEKEISYKSFMRYMKKIDRTKKPIEKTRYYFPREPGKFFELDIFHGFNQGLVILEIELTSIDEKFDLPDFLIYGREVTLDKAYSNKSLASKSRTK